MNPQDIAIFTGTANPQLALDIAHHLGLQLGHATVGRFDDGKVRVQIHEDVRDRDVYVVQPDGPQSVWFEETKHLIVSAKRSAGRVTVVVPYFSSGRGDRRDEPGKPIPAALAAREYMATKADRVVLFDLHSDQIVGMFEAAGAEHVDALYFRPVILDRLSREDLSNVIVSPPDVGRLKVVRSLWKRLRAMGHPVALGVIDKSGTSSTGIEEMTVLGDFAGKNVILFDDILGTGSTAIEAARAALDHGAIDVTLWETHSVLPSRDSLDVRLAACERLASSPVKRIFVSDTLSLGQAEREILDHKLEIVSISCLFALVIRRLHTPRTGHRMSNLFELDGYRAGLAELPCADS